MPEDTTTPIITNASPPPSQSTISNPQTSPPPPKALLSSSADLSPGLPTTTPPIDPQTADLRTPRPTTSTSTNSSSNSAHLRPLDRRPSRPTSTASFISSTSSRQSRDPSTSSSHSPICTPKIRDFAYPRSHKFHAPAFNTRRYSVSSRSSTSSDLDSFFPQRIGGGLYISEDDWRAGVGEGGFEGEGDVDGEEEELVEKRAVCVFDFAAECEGEISIEIGQVVWVEFRKGVSGWLVVRDEITGKFQFSCKERD